jgi:uncharacterized membrane protein YccC
MCEACGGKIGMSWSKTLVTATPVPLALAAGFLVPSGEDKLLLWLLGTATMFFLYFRWVRLPGRLADQAVE